MERELKSKLQTWPERSCVLSKLSRGSGRCKTRQEVGVGQLTTLWWPESAGSSLLPCLGLSKGRILARPCTSGRSPCWAPAHLRGKMAELSTPYSEGRL